MEDLLRQLVCGEPLTREQARAGFDAIFEGRANEAQVGAMLGLIAARGPTVDEIVGAATAMRERAVRIPTDGLDSLGVLIDTCGTGGAVKTFNISTAAAIVAAAARGRIRVLVAKHGGRSRTGRGSAEVLERLGVNIAASPSVQRRCLEDAGVCFAFAVHHHPAMKFAAGPRKSLGFPTIFNLLGPLTNPAGAKRQVIGVYDERLRGKVAEALRLLGCERAWVLHAADGMDEVSSGPPTHCAALEDGVIREVHIDPAALGIRPAAIADLQQAATLDAAADLLRRVLAGEPGPPRDIVLLNAAAGLVVAGAATDLRDGLALAAEAIDSGRASGALKSLALASHDDVDSVQ